MARAAPVPSAMAHTTSEGPRARIACRKHPRQRGGVAVRLRFQHAARGQRRAEGGGQVGLAAGEPGGDEHKIRLDRLLLPRHRLHDGAAGGGGSLRGARRCTTAAQTRPFCRPQSGRPWPGRRAGRGRTARWPPAGRSRSWPRAAIPARGWRRCARRAGRASSRAGSRFWPPAAARCRCSRCRVSAAAHHQHPLAFGELERRFLKVGIQQRFGHGAKEIHREPDCPWPSRPGTARSRGRPAPQASSTRSYCSSSSAAGWLRPTSAPQQNRTPAL